MKISQKTPPVLPVPPISDSELERLGDLMDEAWAEAAWDGANRPTGTERHPQDPISDVWENAGWDGANR